MSAGIARAPLYAGLQIEFEAIGEAPLGFEREAAASRCELAQKHDAGSNNRQNQKNADGDRDIAPIDRRRRGRSVGRLRHSGRRGRFCRDDLSDGGCAGRIVRSRFGGRVVRERLNFERQTGCIAAFQDIGGNKRGADAGLLGWRQTGFTRDSDDPTCGRGGRWRQLADVGALGERADGHVPHLSRGREFRRRDFHDDMLDHHSRSFGWNNFPNDGVRQSCCILRGGRSLYRRRADDFAAAIQNHNVFDRKFWYGGGDEALNPDGRSGPASQDRATA